jgi:site-specific DNA-cytosine methylase
VGPVSAQAFDWQAGAPESDGEGGKGRKWIHRAGDYTGALGTTRTDGVVIQGLISGDRCAVDLLPDGPRYAACGDAVTVNVAEWIGRRLAEMA